MEVIRPYSASINQKIGWKHLWSSSWAGVTWFATSLPLAGLPDFYSALLPVPWARFENSVPMHISWCKNVLRDAQKSLWSCGLPQLQYSFPLANYTFLLSFLLEITILEKNHSFFKKLFLGMEPRTLCLFGKCSTTENIYPILRIIFWLLKSLTHSIIPSQRYVF